MQLSVDPDSIYAAGSIVGLTEVLLDLPRHRDVEVGSAAAEAFLVGDSWHCWVCVDVLVMYRVDAEPALADVLPAYGRKWLWGNHRFMWSLGLCHLIERVESIAAPSKWSVVVFDRLQGFTSWVFCPAARLVPLMYH